MNLPKITKKQQEIIYLYSTYRFLNRLHIQQFLNHKNKKRVNTWLPDLVTKHYLEKVPQPNTFASKTKPTIYHLGLNGIRLLKIQDAIPLDRIHNLYREKFKKASFIDRCQLLADICLMLLEKNKSNAKNSYSFITQRAYEKEDSPFNFLTELNPHLCFIKQTGRKKKYFLLEIFEETLPKYRRKKRIQTYIEFFEGYEWDENMDEPFPVILFVCPTKPLLISAKRMTKRLLEDGQIEDIHMRFTTTDEVKEFGVTGEIWEEVEIEDEE